MAILDRQATHLLRAIKESLRHDDMHGMQRYGYRLNIEIEEDLEEYCSDDKEIIDSLDSINWCRKTCLMLPLTTAGDGNCLLHSLSRYMWGVHDFYLLRRKMQDVLNDGQQAWFDTWHYFQTHPHLNIAGAQPTDQPYIDQAVWYSLWFDVLNIWAFNNKEILKKFLSEFHVFVMANLLRRPIIVLGKRHSANAKEALQEGAILLYDIICGIYLPLNVDPSLCERSPVLICYSVAAEHFVPLMRVCPSVDLKNKVITGDHKSCTNWKAAAIGGGCSNVVPLISPDNSLLTLKFKRDRSVEDLELLYKYLNVHWLTSDGEQQPIPCAALNDEVMPSQWSISRPDNYLTVIGLDQLERNKIAEADWTSNVEMPDATPPKRHMKLPIYVCDAVDCYEPLTSSELNYCIKCSTSAGAAKRRHSP